MKKKKQSMESEIASGQEKIGRLSAELDDTKAAVIHTQDEIEKTQKALRQSQADSKEQYSQMKQRIRFYMKQFDGYAYLYFGSWFHAGSTAQGELFSGSDVL